MERLLRVLRQTPVKPGSVCGDIVQNVDFAATWLEFAGLPTPPYMQGVSFLDSLQQRRKEPQGADVVAYHRYWMHRESVTQVYVSLRQCRNQNLTRVRLITESEIVAGS